MYFSQTKETQLEVHNADITTHNYRNYTHVCLLKEKANISARKARQ